MPGVLGEFLVAERVRAPQEQHGRCVVDGAGSPDVLGVRASGIGDGWDHLRGHAYAIGIAVRRNPVGRQPEEQ